MCTFRLFAVHRSKDDACFLDGTLHVRGIEQVLDLIGNRSVDGGRQSTRRDALLVQVHNRELHVGGLREDGCAGAPTQFLPDGSLRGRGRELVLARPLSQPLRAGL